MKKTIEPNLVRQRDSEDIIFLRRILCPKCGRTHKVRDVSFVKFEKGNKAVSRIRLAIRCPLEGAMVYRLGFSL